MRSNAEVIDREISTRLKSYSERDKDYWSFRKSVIRGNMHECFQYPSMMVPQMQGELISVITEILPETSSIYEPFVGSGTVMVETMKRGLNFTGQDINPLAVLLCRAKSGPFYDEAIRDRVEDLIASIKQDKKSNIEANFSRLDKWFRKDVATDLSKIRRAIRKEKYLWCRRFYWMALAETVRITNNSRITTYKLHIRPKEEIYKRQISAIEIFRSTLFKNLLSLTTYKNVLRERSQLYKGLYKGDIEISLNDSSKPVACKKSTAQYDLLVTSPPYGDNKTTIPYGQYSFLPLHWIDLYDVDDGLDESWISTTHEIDSRSLGGSLRKATDNISDVLDLSPSLCRTMQRLRSAPKDRSIRVAAFWKDLYKCIDPILAVLKPHAYMVWTVGNRNVAGRPIPMNKIFAELLTAKGATLVESISRPIPTKRMAVQNNVSATVNTETILVFRKSA